MAKEWPKHPDGRPKKIGEMTFEEARDQTRIACDRLKTEFENPAHQAAMARYLDGKFDA